MDNPWNFAFGIRFVLDHLTHIGTDIEDDFCPPKIMNLSSSAISCIERRCEQVDLLLPKAAVHTWHFLQQTLVKFTWNKTEPF